MFFSTFILDNLWYMYICIYVGGDACVYIWVCVLVYVAGLSYILLYNLNRQIRTLLLLLWVVCVAGAYSHLIFSYFCKDKTNWFLRNILIIFCNFYFFRTGKKIIKYVYYFLLLLLFFFWLIILLTNCFFLNIFYYFLSLYLTSVEIIPDYGTCSVLYRGYTWFVSWGDGVSFTKDTSALMPAQSLYTCMYYLRFFFLSIFY